MRVVPECTGVVYRSSDLDLHPLEGLADIFDIFLPTPMSSVSNIPIPVLGRILTLVGSCKSALVCVAFRDIVYEHFPAILIAQFQCKAQYALSRALDCRKYAVATDICRLQATPTRPQGPSRCLVVVCYHRRVPPGDMVYADMVYAMAEILLSQPACDPNFSDGFPLLRAAELPDTRVLSLLLRQPSVKASVCGSLALQIAARMNNTEAVRLLLTSSSSPATADSDPRVLHSAVRHGNALMVAMLLSAPTNPARADANQSSALEVAADFGRSAIVSLLMSTPQHAARADANNGAALMSAAAKGHAEVVELLMNAPQHAAYANTGGGSALGYAASSGHANVVDLLLSAPTNRAIADSVYGHLALAWAALHGHFDVVQKLLYFPQDPAPRSCLDGNALLNASQKGHINIVRLLLGAPKPMEPCGTEAVTLAAENGHEEVVRMLLMGDGVVGGGAWDLDGRLIRAQTKALRHGHKRIAAMLLAYSKGIVPRLLRSSRSD